MFFVRIVGIVPLGIGLTVLGFLWGSSWNDFHSPPLFFRIFGSFIALGFVLFGGAMVFGKMASPAERLKAMQDELREAGLTDTPVASKSPHSGKLKCPNCGSSPGTAEVSPHGDVKCDHCSRWYNVHTA
jgi:hypothetical protein